MTNTGTARQQIADTAEADGWTLAQDTVTGSLFDRGTDTVTVSYTRTGAVRWGTRNGVAAGYQGKRETVIGWLTEAPTADEGVTMTNTEQDPFGPLDREGPAMGQVQRPDGWVDPMDTDDEDEDPAPEAWTGIPSIEAVDAALVNGTWTTGPRGLGTADPVPARSARDEIYDAHLGRSWSLFATTDRHYGFRRGEVMVSISFTEDGAIVEASRRTDGVRTPENTRQLYVVIEWLTGGPEPLSDDLHARALDENADRDRAQLAILRNTRNAENDALQEIGELTGFLPGQLVTDLPEHVRLQLDMLRRQRDAARQVAAQDKVRIAELEQTATVIWTEVQADRVRTADRIAELETQSGQVYRELLAARGKVGELETLVSQGAELVATLRTDYRQARERITELEDAAGPMRRQLLDALGELDRPPLAQIADPGDRGRKGDALRAILSRHLP